ncbi:MAG: 4-(cytidine 5'-diphospho)-2-C-methyl-D-erythritol kinase [Candidatus Caenarcaniphilales bacterium]|nr:4-(cytidine 5'-diphospho)-2-C-methyl-D-erythritol kinase [Candidatus Caenarcaniphilales bacterium]
MSNTISVYSAAKLNLYLSVGERQVDGYHSLETVFQTIDLYDRLSFELLDSNDENLIEIKVAESEQSHLVPTDKSNLVYKAARLFFRKISKSNFYLKILINKKIPVAAGLAGGSGNAAATLFALNYLSGEPLDQSQLLILAKELGSDVPFCLLGGCMLGTGRGDQLTRLSPFKDLSFVIVFPPTNETLSTKEIYSEFDKLPRLNDHNKVTTERFIETLLTKGDAISKILFNSLEEVVVSKSFWVDRAKSAIDSNGFHSLVSGSGPSVFTIAPNEAQANYLIDLLKKQGFEAGFFRPTTESFQLIVN